MKKRVFAAVFLVVILISLVSAMTINVISPENGKYYVTSSVNVSVDFGEIVNWQIYHNGESEWNSQGSGVNNLLTATEGLNILRILASNISNSSISIENTTNFYVDTLFPEITSQTPEPDSQKYIGEIPFSVTYTEANLNYTKLYWKIQTDSSYNVENIAGCVSGTPITCYKNINFSSFSNGTNINYFFNLTDKASRSSNFSVYTFKLIACTTSWNCTSWSPCSGGTQTRTCTKICENGTESPPVNQTCTCTPSWSCTAWSDSSNACGTRTCTDSNSCGTNTDKPSESQSCSSETQNTETTNTQTTNIQNINYFLSESQIGNGSLRTLKLAGDKISFKIKNESHVLELRKIFSDKVSIKISSVEQYANLSLNEVKKFDLTADRYYDVLVILKRLTSSEADILINATNEKVPDTVATTVSTNIVNTTTAIETNNIENETANETESFGSRITGGFLGAFENLKEAPIYLLVIFGVVIVGLVGTTIFMILRKKKKKRWGRK